MLIRIVLDTSVVHDLVNGECAIDTAAVSRLHDQVRISISATGFAELYAQLRGNFPSRMIGSRLDFERWRQAAPILDSLLDTHWPFAPNQRQLASLAHWYSDVEPVDEQNERSYMQQLWYLLRDATNPADIERHITYEQPDGALASLQFSRCRVMRFFVAERREWSRFIVNTRDQYRARGMNNPDFSVVLNRRRSEFGAGPHDHPQLLQKLDARLRVESHFIQASLRPITPYDPWEENRRGDALDADLFFYLGLPAVLCVHERRYRNLLEQSQGANTRRLVMRIDELNQHCRSGTLVDLVRQFRNAADQEQDWRLRAYDNWVARERPLWQDLIDWNEAEPLA